MFTPQEIQEQTFSKAVFGGYDMQQVDDFLEPLTEDYITLYKENAVLKSKMKILVEKLEEYRTQEEGMKRAMANAQQTCDKMIAEAQAKCASMMNDAQGSVRSQTAGLQQTLAEDIASEISENLEKLVGSEPAPTPRTAPAQSAPSHPDSATIKFTDLKFGKNYDPTSV